MPPCSKTLVATNRKGIKGKESEKQIMTKKNRFTWPYCNLDYWQLGTFLFLLRSLNINGRPLTPDMPNV